LDGDGSSTIPDGEQVSGMQVAPTPTHNNPFLSRRRSWQGLQHLQAYSSTSARRKLPSCILQTWHWNVFKQDFKRCRGCPCFALTRKVQPLQCRPHTTPNNYPPPTFKRPFSFSISVAPLKPQAKIPRHRLSKNAGHTCFPIQLRQNTTYSRKQ
jgi:hypothetical protein